MNHRVLQMTRTLAFFLQTELCQIQKVLDVFELFLVFGLSFIKYYSFTFLLSKHPELLLKKKKKKIII